MWSTPRLGTDSSTSGSWFDPSQSCGDASVSGFSVPVVSGCSSDRPSWSSDRPSWSARYCRTLSGNRSVSSWSCLSCRSCLCDRLESSLLLLARALSRVLLGGFTFRLLFLLGGGERLVDRSLVEKESGRRYDATREEIGAAARPCSTLFRIGSRPAACASNDGCHGQGEAWTSIRS